MSEITISLEEYNAMKKSLEQQGDEIAKLDKQISMHEQLNEVYQDMLDELVYSSLIERIFKWNKLLKSLGWSRIDLITKGLKK